MLFTCSSCGATHETVGGVQERSLAAEEIGKLRSKWLYVSAAHVPAIGDEVSQAETKASLAYFGTFRSGVPGLPPTITTVNTPTGFRFRCVGCMVSW